MRLLRVLVIITLIVAIFITAVSLMPPEKVESNPFLVGEGLPMIAAHRGGGENNPENTMLAFRAAVNQYRVDIIESDLYLTKDGYLVYNHDSYVDRTCNINGDISYDEMRELIKDTSKRHYIENMTLEELQSYNFGYYFENENGERIYRDAEDIESAGLQIATVEQLFLEFYESNPDLMFIVEIKNEGERGYEACRILAEVLESYPEYKDNLVIGTVHPEIEEHLRENYPDLMRGASTSGAAKFILTTMLGIGNLTENDFSCLQIPLGYDVGIEIDLES
ncbi:MAG: hypothetical protein J6V80_07180, partial [Clostridia bacterium]|nr:hypothetical protein [Clostridia bacterium]